MIHVFAYGSLADPERQKILCGKTFTIKPAILKGFRLDEEPGYYRMIYKDPTHEVRGHIVMDLTKSDLEAFDEWEVEGDLYKRIRVDIEVDGVEVRGWAYEGMGRRAKKPD